MKSFSVWTSQETMRIKVFMKFSLHTLGMKYSLFSLACYYHRLDSGDNDNNDDNGNGLKVIPIAVVCNEVNYERNVAFHCNLKVSKMVCNQIDRTINTVYIWSVICASRLCSQHVFCTLSFYPPDLKIF